MPRKSKPVRLWYRLQQVHPDGTQESSEARQYPDLTELMRVTQLWYKARPRKGDVFTWYANHSDAVTGWKPVMKLEVRQYIGGGLVLYPVPLGRA